MDYKDTINLPKTEFPMKANLPQREPVAQKLWHDSDIYSKIQSARSGQKKYVLHDGPPYANGRIHIGHALNKTLKDIVVKYKTMRGFNSAYVPGWDCHGLPVEHQLFKELDKKKDEVNQVEFRKKAFDYAMKYVAIQREEFERLGVFADWQNPYLTTDKSYEAAIIRSFAKLVKDGYIYKGLKPVNYCYRCETALAEAEVEYEDHTSPSVYVKFKLKDSVQQLVLRSQGDKPLAKEDAACSVPAGKAGVQGEVYILIWTTTPWTLMANVAVAVHPDLEYVIADFSGQNLIMARALLEKVAEKTRIKNYNILSSFKGKDLEGLDYEHPFGIREGKIVLADYVSMEDGSGCVHTAPGHGQEDYITGLKYKLPIVMPVDPKGRFTDEGGEFKGMNVHKADQEIINKLKALGALLYTEGVTHSYPHCWRCKSPIIFRATEQWFLSIDHNGLRKKILSEIKNVKWIPPQGEERISSMVENRPDWCLSRQRYWGVPIPAFRCKKCDTWIADHELIGYVAGIIAENGSDAWFEKSAQELLPKGFACKCGSGDFDKGSDILDVWFESGVSHQAVLKQRSALGYPCELYLEGSDQHRGWFQSSIITSIGLDGKSAFKSVLTHGFVVDGEGRKMSKSTGNVIAPQEIIKDYGADILRLWVASSDYNDDVRISDTIITRLSEAYRKVRNTARFILGNLYDFDPEKDMIPEKDLLEVDRYAVSRAHSLLKDIETYYETFAFHKVYHALYNFCVVDMSNFYLDILKDRLYTFKADSPQRRSCQSAMYEILKVMAYSIAPVLVFTSEEIWHNMPKTREMPESIHMALWPDVKALSADKPLEAKWQRMQRIRDLVLKVLEEKRTSGIIGSSLQAKVSLYAASGEAYTFLKEYESNLPEIFIVSQAELRNEAAPQDASRDISAPEAAVKVEKAEGAKCVRCWNVSTAVGHDKEHNDLCPRCTKVVKAMKGEM